MPHESSVSQPALPEPERGEMILRVKFRISFRELFGAGEKDVRLPRGSSMSRLLDCLCDTAERRTAVMSGTEISGHVVILKNGVPVRGREGLAEELSHGDVVAIFPLLAGG
jgi:molybdopterin converting factor small subunit